MLKPVLIICIIFFSCSNKYGAFVSQYNFTNKSVHPDYSNMEYWAAHPWKWDPSDSVPKPLRTQQRDSVADVFFIYPTTYTGTKQNLNADINDAELNAKTDYSSILFQASVFNQHCRIFSPRYRQAHFSAFFQNNEETKAAFDTAYADLKNAFEFYLLHYNNRRPIIIAGHSQGALMAIKLLKDFFDGKALQQQLVAAYIIGWPVAQNSFQKIEVCKDSIQTECFCTWRTLRKDYTPNYIEKESSVSYVTNPLSWTITNDYVSSKQNKGSVLRDFNKVIKGTTDGQINKGVLWVNKLQFPGAAFYRSKNYHIGDINLFYINLRENVETRLRNFNSL